MSVTRGSKSKGVVWESGQGEGSTNEPLMVAMQPGADVPAVEHVEVVVVTEGADGQITEEVISPSDIQNVVTTDTGQIVAVGACEEVKGEGDEEPDPESGIPGAGDNEGVYGALTVEEAEESPVESASDDDDDRDGVEQRKTPKPREFAHRLQWRDKDMMEAMKSVSDKKMTIRGAAKKYGVPYSTLKDRIHGRVRHGTKPGVKTALSPEEEEDLVQYIKDMENAGFQLRCIDVRDRAAEILRLNHGHNSPYKDCSPGHNWLAGFLKRHPGLSFKRAVNRIGYPPSFQKIKGMLRKFYETTAYVYKKHRMTKKGDRVFVVGELHVHVFLEATILSAASANGSYLPPFVVFPHPGQRQKLNAAREAYPEAFFTNSYSGKISEEIFLWWFRDHFLKQLSGIPRPCVLFICRPLNDVTFQLVQLAKEERVHLISIPPATEHLLQPLDANVSETLETLLEKRAQKWQEENPGAQFTQETFAQLLKKVYRKSINANEIMHKFTTTGVYPLNNTAVSNEKISAALRTRRDDISISEDSEDLSGLSLLSALSSHEYASMEHVYTSGGSARTSLGPRGLSPAHSSNSSHDSTPARPAGGKTRSKLAEVMESFSPPAKRRKQNHEALESGTRSETTTRRSGFSGLKVEPDQNIYGVKPSAIELQSVEAAVASANIEESVVVEGTSEMPGEVVEEEIVDQELVEQQVLDENNIVKSEDSPTVKGEDPSIEVTLEVIENDQGQREVVTEYVTEFMTPKVEVKRDIEQTQELSHTILQDGRVLRVIGNEKVVTENLPSAENYITQEQVVTEMPAESADSVGQQVEVTAGGEQPEIRTELVEVPSKGNSQVIMTSSGQQIITSGTQIIMSDGSTILTPGSRQGFISIPPTGSGSDQVYIQISEEMIQKLVQEHS